MAGAEGLLGGVSYRSRGTPCYSRGGCPSKKRYSMVNMGMLGPSSMGPSLGTKESYVGSFVGLTF